MNVGELQTSLKMIFCHASAVAQVHFTATEDVETILKHIVDELSSVGIRSEITLEKCMISAQDHQRVPEKVPILCELLEKAIINGKAPFLRSMVNA